MNRAWVMFLRTTLEFQREANNFDLKCKSCVEEFLAGCETDKMKKHLHDP